MNQLSTASCYQKHYQGNEWKRTYYIKMFVLPPSPFSVLLFICDMTAVHLKYMHLNIKGFNHCKHALCSPLKIPLVCRIMWMTLRISWIPTGWQVCQNREGCNSGVHWEWRKHQNLKKYSTKSTERGLRGDFSQFLTSVSLQHFIC